jgi:hypothetical protein
LCHCEKAAEEKRPSIGSTPILQRITFPGSTNGYNRAINQNSPKSIRQVPRETTASASPLANRVHWSGRNRKHQPISCCQPGSAAHTIISLRLTCSLFLLYNLYSENRITTGSQLIRNMETEMHTKNQISLTSKILYGITLLAGFLAAFGSGNLTPARAQGPNAETPAGAVVSISADKVSFSSPTSRTPLRSTIPAPR